MTWTGVFFRDEGKETVSKHVLIELELPADLEQLRLPAGVNQRLQELLDHQDTGEDLTPAERKEAEGLVNLAELLALFRLRAQRVSQEHPHRQ